MSFYAAESQSVLTPVASWRYVACCVILLAGCRGEHADRDQAAPQIQQVDSQPDATDVRRQNELALIERVRPQVEAFCGDCHAVPRPASAARSDWTEEVNQGFMLYGESGRSDLEVPPYDDVLKFFEYQAPEQLSLPKSIVGRPKSPIAFRPQGIRLPGSRPPGVANIQWLDLDLKKTPGLVYCDIGSGAVKAHWPREPEAPTQRLATLLQPVHVEACDLDNDGWKDLVVADIGEFDADDSDLGRVVWLRRKPDTEQFETIVLQEPLARVSDVQPGDFDGDGDIDLVVAEFGWRKTGRIVLLENLGGKGSELQTRLREIDSRHGPIHVPPIDLNGDGHLDFVALISQDHEVVEAFLNDGEGEFSREVIWAAPDPAYGSSGIELVDLDQDGDMDVLYTNGDSFDRGPKPYHSVQWLENEGGFPFVHHHIAEMPGVLDASAVDVDADGDLDIVATSMLSHEINQQLSQLDTSSVVLMLQTEPGRFEPTQIEAKSHNHLALQADDFDNDGDIDIAVGTYRRDGGAELPDMILWWNEG